MPKKSNKKISIILTRSLTNKKGKPGDVIQVRAGYANNYLLRETPNKPAMAKMLIGNEHIIEEQKQSWIAEDQKQKEANSKIAKLLENAKITLKKESGMGGTLYGSVSAKDISQAIMSVYQVQVEKRFININPIKFLGDYTAKIKLGEEEIKLPVAVVGM